MFQQEVHPVFSIIVPVYNVAEYLEKCLKSIDNQSFKDIEVIVVDDGSTDASLEICNRFAKNKINFRIYTKKNEGQGVARNFGMEKAQGEFICFVDSDDWIEQDLCLEMFRIACTSDADFINFGLDFISSSGKIKKKIDKFLVREISGNEIFSMALLDDQILSSPCNKIYRRKFLVENNIYFPTLRVNEDLFYSRAVSYHAKKTLFISKVYYHALVRADSTTRSMSLSNFTATKKLFKYERVHFLTKNVNQSLENLFQAHVIKLLSGLLIQSAFRIKSREQYMRCFDVAQQCGFYEYSSKLDVLVLIKLKNILMIKICSFPRILRILAAFSKQIGLTPY